MGGIGRLENLDGMMNGIRQGLIELHPATETIRQQLLRCHLFNGGFEPAPHFDGVSMKFLFEPHDTRIATAMKVSRNQ